jgi:hypothetical protein
MRVCRRCGDPLPNWVRIDGRLRNIHNRKFCLNCSPFGHHNTLDLSDAELWHYTGTKTCPRCGKTLPLSEFYVRKNRKRGTRPSSWCKECERSIAGEQHRSNKAEAVAYKGGRCQRCGYDRCLDALEFHHRDLNAKEFAISRKRYTKFELIKNELDQCDLLCANCHREAHALQAPVA